MDFGSIVRRRSLLAVMPFLFGAVAVPALGQESPLGRVRMGFNGNYPPFSFHDGPGPLSGILVDAIGQVAAATGIAFDYTELPWARAQQMVRAGHLDAICTVSTAERRLYLDFAPTPLLDEPTVLVYRAGDKRGETASVAAGLAGLRIGEPLGAGWFTEVLPHAVIEWAADTDNLLGMIAAGRIDASLLGAWTVKAHLSRLGLDGALRCRPVSVAASDSSIRFGLRKSFPDGAEVVAKVDEAVKAMQAIGALARIIERYTG